MFGGVNPLLLGTGVPGTAGLAGAAGPLAGYAMLPQLQPMVQMVQLMATPGAGAGQGLSPDMSAMLANYSSGKPLVAGTGLDASPVAYYSQFLKGTGISPADLEKMISNHQNGRPWTEGTSLANGGGGAVNGANVDLGSIRGGTAWGRALAADARANATGSGGWCLKYTGQALARAGVKVSGASAYMAGDQMARSDKFHEVQGLRANQLPELPPGAVVVWDRSPGHPHGHISISLGDGREASDVIRKQATKVGTGSFRVFLPNQ